MFKSISVSLLALVTGLTAVAAPTAASAYYRRHASCCSTGPVAPSYVYNTVQSVSHVTRYHDVQQTQYVVRPQPIVHVTQVQPVYMVHDVTRVHNVVVPVVQPYDVGVTQYLPPQQIVTQSVVNAGTYEYGCGCNNGFNIGW